MTTDNLREISEMQSSVLVEKAKDGDEAAFSRLVSLWFKRVYNFGFKYFGDHDVTMEVTQKTFISVYKNLDKLQDVSRFKPWLYKIAYNQFHEEERRAKRKQWLSISSSGNEKAEFEKESNLMPEEEYRNKELTEILKDYLNKIPEEQRTVVIMKEYEGFKFREIAETLGVSENTVKSRLYYGLKGLRKMMSERNITLENI